MLAAALVPFSLGDCAETADGESYVCHTPISVIGQSEIALLDCVKGAGTEVDPYVIEGLDISAGPDDACIQIQRVSCHIIIRNASLHDGRNGVYLVDSSNIAIENSIMRDNHNGVALMHCTGCAVLNNTFEGNKYAVWNWSSSAILVSGNTYLDNEYLINEPIALEGLDAAGQMILLVSAILLIAAAIGLWRIRWFSRRRHFPYMVAARLMALGSATAVAVLVAMGPVVDMYASGRLTREWLYPVTALVIVLYLATCVFVALVRSSWVTEQVR